MKHLKTFEQVQDFYMTDNKSIIVSEDEKYVLFSFPDHNRFYLLDISLLDKHFDKFQLETERAEKIVSWNQKMIDEFDSPKTHIIKMDQFLEETFNKTKFDIYNQLIHKPVQKDSNGELINPPVNVKLKVIKFNIGAQNTNNKLNF